jgi:hypothetical protein
MSLHLAATAKYIATKIWKSLRVENYIFKKNKILANSLEFLQCPSTGCPFEA